MSKGQKFYAKIKDLLPLLKKVFIDYYGKEYKDKITSTLESVRFVITDSRGNFLRMLEIIIMYWSRIEEKYLKQK